VASREAALVKGTQEANCKMQDDTKRTWLSKLLDRLRKPSIDDEIKSVTEDIAFLSSKIRLARQMHSDVLASKMIAQRDKLIKKHERLLAKRRQMFNY
jgi:hypothetical protein